MRKSALFFGAAGLVASPALTAPSRADVVNLGDVEPIGDSITDGYADYGPAGNVFVPGGYRTAFFNALTGAGYGFNFAGSRTRNASATLAAAGQTAQNGWDGYQISMMDQSLTGPPATQFIDYNSGHWLDGDTDHPATNPSVVLLEGGTNDLSIGGIDPATDVSTVLDHLLADLYADRPEAQVYVSELLPSTDNSSLKQEHLLWNSLLPGEIVRRQAAGQAVYLVHDYGLFTNADGSANLNLFSDDVHPDQQGYDLLGGAFAAAVMTNNPIPVAVAAGQTYHFTANPDTAS